MTEPVEQRRRQLFIAEDLDPFAKGQIRSDGRRVLGVSLGQEVEEHLAACSLERNKAQFINDQQIDLE